MTIVFSGSPVANVELSDSFNTWRVVTNKTLRDAASTSGNNVFLGTQSFSNTVTITGTLSVTGGGTTLSGNNITANSITLTTANITTATIGTAVITTLQDSSNRTLTIRDEANNVVWGS